MPPHSSRTLAAVAQSALKYKWDPTWPNDPKMDKEFHYQEGQGVCVDPVEGRIYLSHISKKYPVLVQVYAGPHGAMVARGPRKYQKEQGYADHGYIVVMIDGRGTPGRGRAFERAIAGKFHEVPLEDHWRLPRDFVFDATGHINFFHARSIRRLVQSCELEVLAERVSTPAREAYAHRRGGAGLARFWLKQLLLRAAPCLATRLSTYHGALLFRRRG